MGGESRVERGEGGSERRCLGSGGAGISRRADRGGEKVGSAVVVVVVVVVVVGGGDRI